MFSVDTTNITFTAERLSVDLDQNSVPINGTYKDVTVPSAAADTQINQPQTSSSRAEHSVEIHASASR